MVGLDNPLHIALVLVVVLMVFGAKRLPEMGKSMGAGLRGFKDSLQGNEPAEGLTPAADAGRRPRPTPVVDPRRDHQFARRSPRPSRPRARRTAA